MRSPALYLFIALSTVSVVRAVAQKNKPNILVIYTDDHRYTGIHALGKQQVKTPHMDRLVENGISFSNTYLMGAFTGATCTPSRAMLLTGRDLFQLDGIGKNIPTDHTTMGEAFKKAGYNTHMVGKWDQDRHSLVRSFDTVERVMGLGLYLEDHFRMPLWDYSKGKDLHNDQAYLLGYDTQGKLVEKPMTHQYKRGPFGTEEDGPHTSEVFAEKASEYIEGYTSKKPFFMYLAFHAPHDPRQAPKAYVERYPPEKMLLPPSYASQHPFDNGHLYLRDEKLAEWPRTPQIVQKELAAYYAIITHLDAQIGKVISALKKSGQYENTLIILAGDSGLAVGNHGLLGKQNVYDEDGIHVPFILSGGAIKDKGRKIDALSYLHDIFPTLCDLAQIEVPESVTGKSLLPVIAGKEKETRAYTYHAYLHFQRAFRQGDYKLIEYVRADAYDAKTKMESKKGSRVTQLFNIKKDPWETFDLVGFPEYQALLESMRKEMKQAAMDHGDDNVRMGLPYGFWNYFD
ncbi:sulfatase-like hydrolase/transferase [Fulvivirga sp. M361]|uniref:sulfatase-like hydrolase/transferase n=1 Tax=Fulvivirga sp. M361 TaxID=2594266 RepID=UPI001C88258F|nr:sulfatase-like hydrolase/transferase [Fulvivirga sp. M361]